MVVFLGKGSALWRGVVGFCPGCPEGGEWVEGASGTQHLSPVLGGGQVIGYSHGLTLTP